MIFAFLVVFLFFDALLFRWLRKRTIVNAVQDTTVLVRRVLYAHLEHIRKYPTAQNVL